MNSVQMTFVNVHTNAVHNVESTGAVSVAVLTEGMLLAYAYPTYLRIDRLSERAAENRARRTHVAPSVAAVTS